VNKQRWKILIALLAVGVAGGAIEADSVYVFGWPRWQGWRSVVASGIGMSAALLLVAVSLFLIWRVRDRMTTRKAQRASSMPKDGYEHPVECQEVWR